MGHTSSDTKYLSSARRIRPVWKSAITDGLWLLETGGLHTKAA